MNLLYRRRNDGSLFVTADRDPSVDLAVPLLHITGLTDFFLPYTSVNLHGQGTGQSYRAADIRAAYLGVGTTCGSLDGSGQVVGIVGYETFDLTDIKACDDLQHDLLTIPSKPQLTRQYRCDSEGGNPAAANSKVEADARRRNGTGQDARWATILFFQGNSGITVHLDDVVWKDGLNSDTRVDGGDLFAHFWKKVINAVQSLMQMMRRRRARPSLPAPGIMVMWATSKQFRHGFPVTLVGGTIPFDESFTYLIADLPIALLSKRFHLGRTPTSPKKWG